MKTITEYIQRLTITTDDDGTRTITRSSSADTATEYRFIDLSPEAQARAISDAIEEETSADNWYCSQTYFAEEEIWNAAQELEKHQPINVGTDAGGSPYGTARGEHWWRHAADWESVTEEQNTGICYSMAICDKWNEYAARIVALQEAIEEAQDRVYLHEENASNAASNGDPRIEQAEIDCADAYAKIADRCEQVAEELTEEAARAVGNVVDGLIEGERDYYSSPEFWYDWYTNGDERFTRDGERI